MRIRSIRQLNFIFVRLLFRYRTSVSSLTNLSKNTVPKVLAVIFIIIFVKSTLILEYMPGVALTLELSLNLMRVLFLSEQIRQRRTELVFQYGVLLLELVTGQSPGGGDGELVRWVQEPGFAGSMQRMVDADLGGVYDAGELRDLVIVARLCTRPGNGAAVVSIPQVLRYLQGKVDGKNR